MRDSLPEKGGVGCTNSATKLSMIFLDTACWQHNIAMSMKNIEENYGKFGSRASLAQGSWRTSRMACHVVLQSVQFKAQNILSV